jgi:predicted ABC-type ATPase
MMNIKNLKDRGFDFTILPADIQVSVKLLSTYTKGTFESENQRLNVLDFEIFKSIYAVEPNNAAVIAVQKDEEFDYEKDHNKSFNSTGYDVEQTVDDRVALATEMIDNKEGIPDIKAEGGAVGTVSNYPTGYRAADFALLSSVLKGKKRPIKMPNGEVHEAQFAIVDLDAILASHNEKTYGSTENYPLDASGDNVNDRNYTGDPNAQSKIIEFAQGLEEDRLIVLGSTPSGTPIITPDGIVVSGNNRTMSLKLAASDYPARYQAYVDFLIQDLGVFGFKKIKIVEGGEKGLNVRYMLENDEGDKKTFLQPVLVRIDYAFPDYNALELSKYNKDTKKAERPIDRAIKLGKILEASERCTNIISGVVGEYETFSDFYSNTNDIKKVKDALLECDILNTQDTPAFFTATGFTDQGKELIENLLAGLVLTKAALAATNDGKARIYRQTIITSLPVLTANKALPELSLNEGINEALLLENELRVSKATFKDFISQINIEGKTFSSEAMYLNRLFASGRNNFKKSIEAYNASVLENQGDSLFGEKPTQSEIFTAHIENKVAKEDKKAIEQVKGFSKPSQGTFKILEEPAEPIPLEDKPKVTPKKMTSNPFIDGNYYKDNPDNVLAETSQASSRFGKTVTVYKGGMDAIDRIEVDLNFVSATEEDNPLLSVITEPVTMATDVDQQVIDNLEQAVEASEKELPKKTKRKKKASTVSLIADDELLETYTAREVWDLDYEDGTKINAEVSVEELRVFMWWKNASGRPIKSQGWLEIADMTPEELYNNESLVNQWVREQYLFYFEGELIPSFLYLAENVYEKKNRLVKVGDNSGHDKDSIIKTYGQKVYDNQVATLEKIFKYQYDRRLMIRSEGISEDDALVIQPISKFAKEFKIATLVEGNPFKWKKITKPSHKRFGTPDFLEIYVAGSEKEDLGELSLTHAFALWLRTDDTIQIQRGITYADIIRIYILSGTSPKTTAVKDGEGKYVGKELVKKKKEEAEWERLKAKSKEEGDRLFGIFLEKQLTNLDKTRLEMQWNSQFNGYVPINYNKVPVILRCNKYDMGKPMRIKPEKREAVAFSFIEGSGLLAYDVGVGKTPSAIFTICQFLETGYSTRPVLVVPNQTYKQWINEFKTFAAHIRINEFYNLDAGYIEDWQDVNGLTKKVEEGSVSIMTYEGMVKLGFNEDTITRIKPSLRQILFQQVGEDESSKKKDRRALALESKVEALVGKHLAKTTMNVEDLGFDFMCYDEAHALKKVFTNVAGESEENLGNSGKDTRPVVRYSLSSGEPSSRGIKGFMLCHYIQTTYGGNTLMLTATPFTNSPLEIYSMLALVGYNKLKKMQLENLNVFFDTFIATSYEMIINARLRPERRQVILGFNNLISLQTLIRRFMNHKTGEEVNVPRPNKIVLPLRSKLKDGVMMSLNEDERIESSLPLSPLQGELMAGVKQYANGDINEDAMCMGSFEEETENEDEVKGEGVELDEDALSTDEKAGVRMLKAMNHARNLALSPYIFDCAGLGEPTAEEYVNTSNKLKYIMECIKTVKAYHDKEGSAMSGIVIYMDRGVHYFKLLREYLIENVGFEAHEVGIISSKIITPVPSKTPTDERKEYVKNLFLGKRFNNDTLEMEKLTDKERCKIVIGSSTIKEGINLQKHSSCLFNAWLDWNPTDIQQLEGRIYRQGNKFDTVRIINPLMIDSMDIFMFQKLEEKTSRINTIWGSEGKTNVLKTQDFNPKDLKYSLIKDPIVLAEMELLEVREKLSEEISDSENKIKRNEKIKGYSETISTYTEKLRENLENYRPLADGQPARNLESMLRLFQEVIRKQTDAEGKKIDFEHNKDPEKIGKGFYSTRYYEPVEKPFYYDELNYANRGMIHETRNYLAPNGVTADTIDGFTEKIKSEIEDLKKQQQAVASDEAIKSKAKEIHEYRQSQHIVEKTLPEMVSGFATLNYLLSELRTPDQKDIATVQCPPVDENGDVRIDPEGLALLEECIRHEPDTKRMHTNEAGEYTEERQALHDRLVTELVGDAVCIERGQPIAVLTGGSPASGKSSFLRKYAPYLESKNIWKVDSDEVRSKLPEYKGWNADSTHQETRDITNQMLDTFDTPCKHDLLYDGTMSNAKKYIPLIRRLKKMGYLVFIAYMEVPKEVAIERSMNRYKNNKGGTEFGRYVPISIIDDFFRTGKEGLNEIKDSVDGYIIVDSLTHKITEKGGQDIPQDRDYAEIFEVGKEKPIEVKVDTPAPPSKATLKTRLKLLKRMPVSSTTKARIKLLTRMLAKMKSGGSISGKEMISTKDGVKVEKRSNKHKGHIFFDEEGGKYQCLGYFPKLDDCVYLNLQNKKEVVGCMDGFYYNNPTK